KAHARRFVHLAEDHRGLAEHAALLHFAVKLRAFARPLTNAREHREPGVLLRDRADQLHDDDGFAGARAPEDARLTTTTERRDQVDHLDARFEHLDRGRLLV